MTATGWAIVAGFVLGLGWVLAREEIAYRACQSRGHLWRSTYQPTTGLFAPRCHRCRRWADG